MDGNDSYGRKISSIVLGLGRFKMPIRYPNGEK